MGKQTHKSIEIAHNLMDDFLKRTGIMDSGGDPDQRYLWTDAFAVHSCFALSHEQDGEKYRYYALKLIELVHHTLGKYRDDDPREGWISGMPPDEGEKHPTAGGLRIGKKLPERTTGEPFNQAMEWESDGQYFHYLTRWFNALLQAFTETGEDRYAQWAAELIMASEKFINKNRGMLTMHWKMNTNLTKPVVMSRGAHDPLEGMVCVLSAMDISPQSRIFLEPLKQDFQYLCHDNNWFTTDALGLGCLLLNTARTVALTLTEKTLPPSIRPEYLFAESLAGLDAFSKQVYNKLKPSETRLAFRECGLSLGIRVLYGFREIQNTPLIDLGELEKFIDLAEDIEDFWSNPSNQQAWRNSRDINTVTLASSLLARFNPGVYCSANNIH